jgi:hypothetical protein
MELALAAVALVFAAIPALLFLRNLGAYAAPRVAVRPLPGVSVLIPARNEEATIGAAVASVLRNTGLDFEVIVLDDESTDGTAAVLDAIADPRLTVIRGGGLPAGWCGKQHACAQLARHAKYPLLCFLDADVRLSPDALVRMASFVETKRVDLASGVPRQQTVSVLEKLLIPLISFVLLGFLPFRRMRRSTHPSYAAGCGQLFIARADAYRAAGGHAAIRTTLHDGINLPRAFRRAGLTTDLFDATDIAVCRMYRSGEEVWAGLRKNATEGLGAPRLIGPITLMLIFGQVLPFLLVCITSGLAQGLSAAAIVLTYMVRFVALLRFYQSALGAVLHPVGIVLLLAIQWQALAAHLLGTRVHWKGRAYAAPAAD